MAIRRSIGMSWLAGLFAALLISLAGCTGLAGSAAPAVPAEPTSAGDDVAALAGEVEGIAGTELTYAPPGEGTSNGMPSTKPGLWEIVLKVRLAPNVAESAALVAARRAAMTVAGHAEDFRWVVTMQDRDRNVDAVVYQSRPSDDAQAINFSQIEYIADARKYRTLPGVAAVSIDGSGTVTTSVADFSWLGNLLWDLQLHPVHEVVVAAPQGNGTFSLTGQPMARDFLGLLTRLGTSHPVKEMSVGESARGLERILGVRVPGKEDAIAVEKALKKSTLAHTEGQAIVRNYVISYGELEKDLDGKLKRPFLFGQLFYAPPLPEAGAAPPEPDTVQAFTPPAYEDSPACTPGQVSGNVEGRVEPALGHRSMKVVLSNLSEKTCSVNGYPVVKFLDADGGDVPVALVNSSSYMFVDPGPAPISLAPGGTAWAMLHWGANSTSQGFILPGYIEVAPVAGGGFAARSPLADTPDIIDGTQIKVSAWAWPDAAAFR